MARDGPVRRGATRAAWGALPLGIFITVGYAVLVRGEGLFEDVTFGESLALAGVVLGLWLVLWPLFAVAERTADRADAMEPGPIELPPRDPADMTGRELAEWARGDPDRLHRLIRRARRRRGGGLRGDLYRRQRTATGMAEDISVGGYLRRLPWVAAGFLVVTLAMWALGTPGLSLPWALLLWVLFTVALGPLVWVRAEVSHRAPGRWRALGYAVLWALGVLLALAIAYGLAMAVFTS